MGLLDDAIREHLDLKRRRGADPAEVARLEQEALGPVRREPAAADAQPAADAPTAHPVADAEPAQPEHAEHPHPASEDPHPDDHTHVLPPEERHEPPHGDPLFEQHTHNVEQGGAAQDHEEAATTEPEPSATDADRAGGDEDARPAGESRTGAHPESSGPARSSVDPKVVDQPTTEYRVEDHHDPDDVLEETPDFLQETPEHDRLWFEQRPPRDFDFDG
jgi:hypothetical protein